MTKKKGSQRKKKKKNKRKKEAKYTRILLIHNCARFMKRVFMMH